MKILRIIHSLNPKNGGPVNGLMASSKVHHELGIKTDVVCLDDPKAVWLREGELEHLTIHALGCGSKAWGYNAKLSNWLRSHGSGYSAMIVHGLWLYPSYAVWKFQKSYRGIWFVFPHGMMDPWFQSWRRRPFKTLRNWIYWLLIERCILRDATAVLYTCKREAILARKTFPFYNAKEVVVPYGSAPPPEDLEVLRSRLEIGGTELKNPYWLFLGRIAEKKGVDLLLGAYEKLLLSKGDFELIPDLVIAGPSLENHYEKRIKDLADQINGLPSGPKVIFTGLVMGEEKWKLLKRCEAFVLPSHQENFGISVVEALSCGRPVLISNQVNLFEEIIECDAGLVEVDDLNGVYRLLERWVALDSSERRRMEANAKRCFEDHFRVSKSAESMIQLIRENRGE